MKKLLDVGCLLVVAAVAMAGCDKAMGKRPPRPPKNPNAVYVSPDGAIRTPEAAREAVRAMKAKRTKDGKADAPIEVVFADGTYRLEASLELTADDSGTEKAPIVWRAANRGKAVFTAATPLAWRKPGPAEADRVALLRPAARGQVRVADLPAGLKIPSFLNGSHCVTPSNDIPMAVFAGTDRLPCARWPDDGFANVTRVPVVGTFGADAPRIAEWTKEPWLWAFGHWANDWVDLRTRVIAVDVAAKTVSVPVEHMVKFGQEPMKSVTPYYVFNAFCELDRPGEWVADCARRQVWLWPEGEGPDAEAVLREHLVKAKGTRDVVFDGIVFEKSRKTAVTLENCERVVVRAATFRHTGSWAVDVKGGRDCLVDGCDLFDLGEGGVKLNGGKLDTLTPGGHVVRNCHIHHYGRVFYNYRQAVWLDGVGNRAEHNLVHHSPHAGIAFAGNDHYIGWNVLHDICTDNDDAGAIYTWQNSWVRRGGLVEHNLVLRTGRLPCPTRTVAVYLDDHSSDVTVRNNILCFASDGIFFGGGHQNRAYGNVCVDIVKPLMLDSRDIRKSVMKELEAKSALCRSPLWRERYPHLFDMLELKDEAMRYKPIGTVATNNVFAASGESQLLNKWDWPKISNTVTIAANAVVAGDPGFRDYAGLDWRAAADSPNRAVIAACGFEKMGLYDDANRASPAVRFGEDRCAVPALRPPLEGARIDLWLRHAYAPASGMDGKTPCGRETRDCRIPGYFKSWLHAELWCDNAPDSKPHDYSFAYVPNADAEVSLEIESGGRPAEYADFRVEGATPERPFGDKGFAVGGFETRKAKISVRKDVSVKVSFTARAADVGSR